MTERPEICFGPRPRNPYSISSLEMCELFRSALALIGTTAECDHVVFIFRDEIAALASKSELSQVELPRNFPHELPAVQVAARAGIVAFHTFFHTDAPYAELLRVQAARQALSHLVVDLPVAQETAAARDHLQQVMFGAKKDPMIESFLRQDFYPTRVFEDDRRVLARLTWVNPAKPAI